MQSPADPIREIAEKVINEAARTDVQSLIVLLRLRLQLIRLRTVPWNGRYVPICDPEITTKVMAGDIGNAAIFWAEMYYEPRSIKHLARVAAQLVVMAGKLNGAMIGGLEVVLCDASGFHPLGVDSNAQLELDANQLNETVRESLLG